MDDHTQSWAAAEAAAASPAGRRAADEFEAAMREDEDERADRAEAQRAAAERAAAQHAAADRVAAAEFEAAMREDEDDRADRSAAQRAAVPRAANADPAAAAADAVISPSAGVPEQKYPDVPRPDATVSTPPGPGPNRPAGDLDLPGGGQGAQFVSPLTISPSEADQKLHDAQSTAADPWSASPGAEHKEAASGVDAFSRPAHVPPGTADHKDIYQTDDGTTMFRMHSQYVGEEVSRGNTHTGYVGQAEPTGYLGDAKGTGYEGEAKSDSAYAARMGEVNQRTYYASEEERTRYEVYVDGSGRFVDEKGNPLDSSGARAIRPGEGIGGHLFIMDESGQNYVARALDEEARLNAEHKAGTPTEMFHHSSLASGQPVAGYGEMIIEQGSLLAVSDSSGHYYDRHNPQQATGIEQTLDNAYNLGANLDATNVHLVAKTLPDFQVNPDGSLKLDGQGNPIPVVLPATDSTVGEFYFAEADQALLYTLQLSAQEWADQDGLDHKHAGVELMGYDYVSPPAAHESKHAEQLQVNYGQPDDAPWLDVEPAPDSHEPFPPLPDSGEE